MMETVKMAEDWKQNESRHIEEPSARIAGITVLRNLSSRNPKHFY